MYTTKKFLCLLLLTAFPIILYAQSAKKGLDHDAYDLWNRINEKAISNDGEWILYSMSPEYGDALLTIKSTDSNQLITVPRGVSARFSKDSRHVVARITPPVDSVRQAKLDKVKKDDMPGDSLAIIDLDTGEIMHIAGIKSYLLPEEAGGVVAYHLKKNGEEHEENNEEEEQPAEEENKKKDKEEGTPLFLQKSGKR